MENQHLIKNLAENSATNSATAQVFKTVLSSAILATALSLSACGGGGGSSSSPEKTSPPAGDEAAPAPQWSTPVALTDGSNYNSLELFDGAGNKPMMVTQRGLMLYSREFDGSNWSDETLISQIDPNRRLNWDINSNGKAIMALSTQPLNPSNNFSECALTYLRYDGTRWDSDSVTTRLLKNPNDHYSCSNVNDFNVALAGDDSLLMTWYRHDLDNSYYQYCGSNNQCATNPIEQANSIGSRFIRGLGLGNDGKGRVLRFKAAETGGVLIAEFDTAQGKGLGSSTLVSSPSIRSIQASMAVNDASHSLIVFDEGSNLQVRFDNGSSLSPAVTLADNLPALGVHPKLQTYLSDGSDYGLTLWREYDNTTKQTPLRSNISDASAFEASSIQHQSEGETVHYRFSGDINDNGKAVIAWFGYSLDANNDRGPATLYSRIYDGNRWLDVEVIDNNIDTSDVAPLKVGVYIDNSDEVTLVYTAKKKDQDTQTEPAAKLFYSRFSTN